MRRDSRSLEERICFAIVTLMSGGRHSRRTIVAEYGVSLPTADRWLAAIHELPGMKRVRCGKTTWLEWRGARFVEVE